MNYARFINRTSAARIASPIRRLTEIQQAGGEDMISLGTGSPNPSCFPFESISFRSKNGVNHHLTGDSLVSALQYGPTKGNVQLSGWLTEMQEKLHGSGKETKREILITPGSQDALCKIFEMVLERGDSVLMEEPSYPGTLAILRPMGVRMIGVKCDEQGMQPDSLAESLKYWKTKNNAPKVLYLQPNCCNPTGVTTPLIRRQKIMQLAREYDLLVIEDDPYYFLTFNQTPPASLLSLDIDGRVLRLDSFSKIVSSGLRLGVVTGPKELVQRVTLHLQVSSMHASSLSQCFLLAMLKSWNMSGFQHHCHRVAEFYRSQCELMLEATNTHMNDICEWNQPSGSMFLWLKCKSVPDTHTLIDQKALDSKVVLAPGNAFHIDSSKPSPFMRASYSNVTAQQMNTLHANSTQIKINMASRNCEFERSIDVRVGDKDIEVTAVQLAEGDVGVVLWDSALVAIKYMEKLVQANSQYFTDKSLLELGAGVGLCGIVASLYGAQVILTDLREQLPLLKRNLGRNQLTIEQCAKQIPSVEALQWGDVCPASSKIYDVILMVDCLYYDQSVQPLIQTLKSVCGPESLILCVYEQRDVGAPIKAQANFLESVEEFFTLSKVGDDQLHPEFNASDIEVLKLTKKC